MYAEAARLKIKSGLRTTLLNDLARYSCIHAVSWVRKWFWLVWTKKLTILYSCVHSLTRLTKFWKLNGPTVSKYVTLQIEPQQLSSIWIEKPTKHICTMSRMATTVFDIICLVTGDTKYLYHAYLWCIRFKLLHSRPLHTLGCRNVTRYIPRRRDRTITYAVTACKPVFNGWVTISR